MIDNVRSPNLTNSVREFIQFIPGELTIDAVGLWQIVLPGRGPGGYALSNGNLIELIRRCILALLRKGAAL